LLWEDFFCFQFSIVSNNLASFAAELVVGVGRRTNSKFEKVSKVFCTYSVDLLLIINNLLQAFLSQLTLKDLLLNGTCGEEAVGEAAFLLTVTPTACGRLLVDSGVPIRVLVKAKE
jgi:hypothetical protein